MQSGFLLYWLLASDLHNLDNLRLQGYEITMDDVEEDEKVSREELLLCLVSELTKVIRLLPCCARVEDLQRSVDTCVLWCLQPKAAVEFDQAINYVNKIKVRRRETLQGCFR